MARTARAVREPACEIRFGQVGIAQLRLRETAPAEIAAELERKIASAPELFRRAAVCLDLNALPALPDAAEAHALIETVRAAGLLPVALAYGTPEIETLARLLDLPVLAKFRAAYEPAVGDAPPTPVAERTEPTPPSAAPGEGGVDAVSQLVQTPVRSGQQVYARGRDLTVLATVGAGAEVIADGSVHVYGALRGRALAGAQGDGRARIFCHEFHAELVAIAGQYTVFEEIPADLRGRPVQVWLEGERLRLARIGS